MFFYSNCFWYTNTRRDCYFIYFTRNIVMNDCFSDVYDWFVLDNM